MNPHEITKEQYDLWVHEYQTFIQSMKFKRPVDREVSMLYCIERMLLRVRLSIGLGDPGTPPPHAPKEEDPEGFREAD